MSVDFIDDNWYKVILEKISYELDNPYTKNDIYHRLARICVNINLAHEFPNGNKRSSIFAFLIVSMKNGIHFRITEQEIYEMSKEIAEKGSAERDYSIDKLEEILREKYQRTI